MSTTTNLDRSVSGACIKDPDGTRLLSGLDAETAFDLL
jgi:hypothetical protein